LGKRTTIDFYGVYSENATGFSNSVFVNSPLVADASAVYFTVRVVPGSVPDNAVENCVVRVSKSGSANSKTAAQLTGDVRFTQFPQNLAPAFSVDGSIMYLVVSNGIEGGPVALVGVDPSTLTVKQRTSDNSNMIVELWDPHYGVNFPVIVSEFSSSSPTVGPDGDVYFGVRGSQTRSSIGWLLHFDKELYVQKV
jgi:hypothetical protein